MKTEEKKKQQTNWFRLHTNNDTTYTKKKNWFEPEAIYYNGRGENNTAKIYGILSICLFWVPIAGLIFGGLGSYTRNKEWIGFEGNNPRRDYWLNSIGLYMSVLVTINIILMLMR